MKIQDLSDIPELKAVEPGEYDLRVKKAIDQKKNNRESILLICDIVGEEEAEDVMHNMTCTTAPTDDPGKAATMLRMTKEFIVAVGLDAGDCSTEDFEGLEFSAFLKLDEYEGRITNKIRSVT